MNSKKWFSNITNYHGLRVTILSLMNSYIYHILNPLSQITQYSKEVTSKE